MNSSIYSILEYGVVGISVIVGLMVIVAAFRSGALTEIRFGNFAFKASSKAKEEGREIFKSLQASSEKDLPFETEQLAKYYGEVLAQSKVSFWFSLIFAVVGFLVIIIAAFMYSNRADSTAYIQMIAGAIIDAVAGLFFVQSRRAQKSMADFFDKLRLDRQHTDSKKMCESIENTIARDALKIELSLYYAGVPDSANVSKSILSEWLAAHEKYVNRNSKNLAEPSV